MSTEIANRYARTSPISKAIKRESCSFDSESMSVSGSGGEVALPLYRPADAPPGRATFEIGRDPPKPGPEPLQTIPLNEVTSPSPLVVDRIREHLERMRRRNGGSKR